MQGTRNVADLDVLIPVYNEGDRIIPVLDSLGKWVKASIRVLICYDDESDTTLGALEAFAGRSFEIVPVRNPWRGPHSAVLAGFRASTAPAVIVVPADDTHNARIFDAMRADFLDGADVVVASRFMAGGQMQGCPWLKAILVRTAAFTLYHIARIPTHDPTNGLRLFSRRVLDEIEIESSEGFTYSLELLAKSHRRGWKITEIPCSWFERKAGTSRFRVLKWMPAYLRWYFYAFSTTYLFRKKKG